MPAGCCKARKLTGRISIVWLLCLLTIFWILCQLSPRNDKVAEDTFATTYSVIFFQMCLPNQISLQCAWDIISRIPYFQEVCFCPKLPLDLCLGLCKPFRNPGLGSKFVIYPLHGMSVFEKLGPGTYTGLRILLESNFLRRPSVIL